MAAQTIKQVAFELKVSGVPLENSKEYSTPFSRAEGECKVDVMDLEFMSLDVNKDNTSSLTLIKQFSGEVSDEEIVDQLNDFSTFVIYDKLSDEVYNANVIGVEGYDIQDY